MSKLTELVNGRQNTSVLLLGKPGAGKTVAALSFPYPTLLLDFDDKADSGASFYRQDQDRLEGVDVRKLSARLGHDPIQEFTKIIDKELVPASKAENFPYKTIILDSITAFSRLVLTHIVLTNPGIKRQKSAQGLQPCMQDYGILRREFQRLIPGLLSLPCNVVMCAHIATDKDELTGEILRKAMMDGSFAEQLPIYFKEVYRIYVDGEDKHMFQTHSDRKFALRSQLHGLPRTVPATYLSLKPYLENTI